MHNLPVLTTFPMLLKRGVTLCVLLFFHDVSHGYCQVNGSGIFPWPHQLQFTGFYAAVVAAILAAAFVLLFFNKRLQREIQEHRKTAKALRDSQQKLEGYSKQTEQFSLSAASILSIKDEKILFDRISDTIVKYSDYERVLISLFNDKPPYRDLIGFAGVSEDIVNRVRKTDLDKSWYDSVFSKGIMLGQFSYYIPSSMKHILNQKATIYGEGEPPNDPGAWHPEDNLFVKMNDEDGEFVGVISVDTSKSGLRPTDEIVRPLEIYASLISQIVRLRRNQVQKEQLENQLRQAQKMEAIGNLTGGIAHDFNNILGIIIGNVDMAMEATPQGPSYEYLEEISNASNRARDIVRHLLAFSRKTEREFQPIAIGKCLEGSIKFVRSTIPSTIQIYQNIDTDGKRILGDSTHIDQIILNLCSNAVHAMEKNGGKLEISAKLVNVSSFSSLRVVGAKMPVPGEYIEISVKDNGSGISADSLEKIFDPYFTTKVVGKGTGMGLAIVHGIVQGLSGAINAVSEPGKGTCLSIYLPSYSTAMLQKDSISKEIALGSESILLVDDDVSLLKTNHRYLAQHGYNVTSTTDPREALKLFSAVPETFDLLITDMTMPHMTGDILAERILAIRPDFPIFLCTGYSNDIDEQSAVLKGIRRYFEKPVSYAKMAAAIRYEFDS